MNIQAGSCRDKWVFLAVQTQENFPFRTFLEFLWNLCLLLPPTHLFVSKPIIVHATNSFMSKNNVCSSVCLGFLSDQSSIIVYPCLVPLFTWFMWLWLVKLLNQKLLRLLLNHLFSDSWLFERSFAWAWRQFNSRFLRLSISLETTRQ